MIIILTKNLIVIMILPIISSPNVIQLAPQHISSFDHYLKAFVTEGDATRPKTQVSTQDALWWRYNALTLDELRLWTSMRANPSHLSVLFVMYFVKFIITHLTDRHFLHTD